jgi:hypothetical protein
VEETAAIVGGIHQGSFDAFSYQQSAISHQLSAVSSPAGTPRWLIAES